MTTLRLIAKELSKSLCDFRDRFAEHGKTNTDYGLPEPADTSTELARFELRFSDVDAQRQLYEQLRDTKPLNAQQQLVFDTITEAILKQTKSADGVFFTLEGSGGCGKTELSKQIMAFISSSNPMR